MGLFWYMDLYRYMGFQDKLKLEFMDLDSIYKIKKWGQWRRGGFRA